MSNISGKTKILLDSYFSIPKATILKSQKSKDGTIKNAITLYDKLVVECVLIPCKKRTTACISSQVGCSLDCNFCGTSKIERKRNLTPDEIVDQVQIIHNQSEENFDMPLRNIVFMGMGEPLMNYKNVMSAINKITSPKGINISPKRITLSTSGIPKMIQKLADDRAKFNLAVSLHSADEKTRNTIMPFSKSFPLEELKLALQYWYSKTKNRVTYEYIIWKGVNDNSEAINSLVKFCKYVPCKVNIIEYNTIGDSSFTNANEHITKQYISSLEQNNITVKIRKSRGDDIDAACGQLANRSTL
ncbi:dual-specificity RNA methyltransferase RlmN [Elysia marginata]|uniref:Dual-specificity RNA methyltransferase RlmN n=1 Tax=Elysia marginata TaxID=1093978 RepID=A0AAV4G514_9GAST|nr:dual-specificity RNA methyltransferase RlmN [Elysia marginata]